MRNSNSLMLLAFTACFGSGGAAAQTAAELLAEGNQLVRSGIYRTALLRYREAAAAGLDTPLLHYNLGVVHYELGDFAESADEFARAAAAAGARRARELQPRARRCAPPAIPRRRARRFARLRTAPTIATCAASPSGARPTRASRASPRAVEQRAARRARRRAHRAHRRARARSRRALGARRQRLPDAGRALHRPLRSGAAARDARRALGELHAGGAARGVRARERGRRYRVPVPLRHERRLLRRRVLERDGSRPALVDGRRHRARRGRPPPARRRHGVLRQHPSRDEFRSRRRLGARHRGRRSTARPSPRTSATGSHTRPRECRAISRTRWAASRGASTSCSSATSTSAPSSSRTSITTTSIRASTSITTSATSWRCNFGLRQYRTVYDERPARDLTGALLDTNPAQEYDHSGVQLGLHAAARARRRARGRLLAARPRRRVRRLLRLHAGRAARAASVSGRRRASTSRSAAIARSYDYPRAFAFHVEAGGARELEEIGIVLEAEYRITPRLALSAELDSLDVTSTDARAAYLRTQAMLGVEWRK